MAGWSQVMSYENAAEEVTVLWEDFLTTEKSGILCCKYGIKFACRGAVPRSMQDVNQMIFSEWLPNCRDYEIAAGYNIEKYSDPAQYQEGTRDENYYSELWIPVKHK